MHRNKIRIFNSKRVNAGFTLVEIMVAAAVGAVFLYCAYKLFIGGSKTADRAQWTNATIDSLQITTSFLNKAIKSTSYPTTLLRDGICDPADNPNTAIAQKYFVKIAANQQELKAPAAGEKKELMKWYSCRPEKPPEPGVLEESVLWFQGQANSQPSVGTLIVETQRYTFTTAPQEYAKSGVLKLTADGKPSRQELVHDVAWVKFEVPGPLPTGPTEFQPLKITIHCIYPKAATAFKEAFTTVTPNVGIEIAQ